MATALYDSDVQKITDRTPKTTLDDTDVLVIANASGTLAPITKVNAKTTLGISDAESAISTLESEMDDLQTAETAIKGTGWTNENLVDHESRIGDLETNDTLQDATLGTLKETVLSTKLAVNELERQAQIGNGATLDFSDIGTVPLDARATGRANPTVEGLTATNIVDGADIANLGTVTFSSVLDHKYYDVLHGTILTGTGSDMTITNDTGATADIAVIYLTGVYGLGSEPSEADCAKIFSYFDGTKSIQLPARIISKSEDETETSTLYIADNEEVRSVPAIANKVKVVNGQLVKVQNVQRYVLQASDILSIANRTYMQTMTINLTTFVGLITQSVSIADGSFYILGFPTEIGNVGVSDINVAYSFRTDSTALTLAVPLGTYADLAAAQADLAGTVIYYQLATPIITPLTTSGTLKAFQNGTVYYEPYYEGSHQTDASSQITLPYEGTIEAVYGYDEDLVEYLLDSSEYSLTGTTLTITDALENEVWFVKMSRAEPLSPEMSVNVINNEQVIADTENGKFYKLVPTITNGVLVSQTPTEVV